MNTLHYKPLHYALIILLILAPLRSVLASQLMACDMEKSPAVITLDAGADVTPDHCQHGSSDTAAGKVKSKNLQGDNPTKYQNILQAKSCCSDSDACQSNCQFALSASLFLQHVEYLPALFSEAAFEAASHAVLVRELTPPSRPPLLLHS